jgi:hypothetical protein
MDNLEVANAAPETNSDDKMTNANAIPEKYPDNNMVNVSAAPETCSDDIMSTGLSKNHAVMSDIEMSSISSEANTKPETNSDEEMSTKPSETNNHTNDPGLAKSSYPERSHTAYSSQSLMTVLTDPTDHTSSRNSRQRSTTTGAQVWANTNKHRLTKYLIAWFSWMAIGTGFYASDTGGKLTFCKAFYQMVNVGYGVGYPYPALESKSQKAFSAIYLMSGTVFVAVAIGLFADYIVSDRDHWYVKLSHKNHMKNQMAFGTYPEKLSAFLDYHLIKVQVVILWGSWALLGFLIFVFQHEKDFWEGLLFAASLMTTAGLIQIPDNSHDWEFFLVAILTVIGVPLTGIALSSFASLLIKPTPIDHFRVNMGESDLVDFNSSQTLQSTPKLTGIRGRGGQTSSQVQDTLESVARIERERADLLRRIAESNYNMERLQYSYRAIIKVSEGSRTQSSDRDSSIMPSRPTTFRESMLGFMPKVGIRESLFGKGSSHV